MIESVKVRRFQIKMQDHYAANHKSNFKPSNCQHLEGFPKTFTSIPLKLFCNDFCFCVFFHLPIADLYPLPRSGLTHPINSAVFCEAVNHTFNPFLDVNQYLDAFIRRQRLERQKNSWRQASGSSQNKTDQNQRTNRRLISQAFK